MNRVLGASHRKAAVAVVAIALAALAVRPFPALAGGPTTWTFPGSCPTATLQGCIDEAMPGDTIELTTNGKIRELISLDDKSFTLTAASGKHPKITKGLQIVITGGSVADSISGISVGGQIDARLFGGSGHTIAIDRTRVEGHNSDLGVAALEVDTQVPASVSVTRTSVSSTVDGADDMVLDATNAVGLVSFRAVGNTLTGATPASQGGLRVQAHGAGGDVVADIYGNRIWHTADCNCGTNNGLTLLAGSTAHATFNVVGNTVDRVKAPGFGAFGTLVFDALDPAGSQVVNLFDNVIADTSGAAVYIVATNPSTLTFNAGFNDFFANGMPIHLLGHSAGPGNMHASPHFADPAHGDLRLTSASPLVDKGLVCSPGGLANLDASGKGRLHGSSVDMGAYELGASGPTGVALVGTNGTDTLTGTGGADILCGMGGLDTLSGLGGNDYVDGGAGNDSVTGGTGRDRLFGRSGADLLCGADGVHANDTIDGGPGTDTFDADPGDVRIAVEQRVPCA